MKPWVIGLIVVAIAGALVFVYFKNQPPDMTSLPDGTTIYDTRTADEYATSHVTSAELWPLSDLQAGKFPTVNKDAWVAVYSQSSNRSKESADLLKKAGYKHVIDMHSIEDTANYGLSIVR
jgi:phage shock protein E